MLCSSSRVMTRPSSGSGQTSTAAQPLVTSNVKAIRLVERFTVILQWGLRDSTNHGFYLKWYDIYSPRFGEAPELFSQLEESSVYRLFYFQIDYRGIPEFLLPDKEVTGYP